MNSPVTDTVFPEKLQVGLDDTLVPDTPTHGVDADAAKVSSLGKVILTPPVVGMACGAFTVKVIAPFWLIVVVVGVNVTDEIVPAVAVYVPVLIVSIK